MDNVGYGSLPLCELRPSRHVAFVQRTYANTIGSDGAYVTVIEFQCVLFFVILALAHTQFSGVSQKYLKCFCYPNVW